MFQSASELPDIWSEPIEICFYRWSFRVIILKRESLIGYGISLLRSIFSQNVSMLTHIGVIERLSWCGKVLTCIRVLVHNTNFRVPDFERDQSIEAVY